MSESIELDPSLRALWRWKWLVLVGAIVAAAVVAAATAATPARYTTTGLVEIGRVMGEQIEDPFSVEQTVNSPGFQASMREHAGAPLPGTVRAEALTGGQGRLEHPTLVRVTVTAPTAEQAVALGNAAVDALVARHKDRFDKAIARSREYERVLAVTGEPAAGPADPEARKELFDVRSRLESPVFTEPTHLKDPFPTPAAPVPKDTVLSAAVAFAVALAILMLGVAAIGQVSAPRSL